MKSIFSILVLVTGLLACKKDKLTGELAVFEGRWKMEWYVKEYYFPSLQSSAYDTITAMTDSYEMEFEKKGKVRFYKNGEEVEKHPVQIPIFLEGQIGCTGIGVQDGADFGINLDNKGDDFINGCINNTTMRLAHNGFPLPNHDEGNARVSYGCFFKKQ